MRGDAAELAAETGADGATVDFVFVEEGSFAYLDGADWVHLEAQFLVIPDGVKRRTRLISRWQAALVRLPRSAMEAFVPELPVGVVHVRERSLLDLSMQAFAVALLQHDKTATAIENYAIEQLLLEMGGAVLLDLLGQGRGQGSPRAVLRDRAMTVIAQQCADVELNPARVAREVQVSLRQLQTVFADIGMTVAGEIRRRRTRLAHALLTDSRYDVLTVDQIAERSGFGTTMSMRRALHEAYGSGPRELRSRRGELTPHSS
ncbi:helix-turn-helix domain-containing protein [Leucobacter sp. wl10]|uniref:AraC family transcriptional regulator n=1 Tax=Leucobacter sp. wl10 TaxID=2304677 RepID=UPI000E5C14AD|nr:helix-turn-helix domain-containing protein [Leucobacter sp. wl10]RGE19797.1 helix-turn-helix domain-containing protein [Leucobacter sp. wl10]